MSLTNLPNGWILKTIGEVCDDPQYGFTTKASINGEIKFLRTTDITKNNISWNSVPYCDSEPEDIEKYQLKIGDVVISRAGTIGVSALIESSPKAVFASYLIRFRPKINPKYFYYFLQSPFYWEHVNAEKVGIAVSNLNATKIKSFPMPIAPSETQELIVKKIESIFNKIDQELHTLNLIQSKIELYKHSILNAAICGKLVPQDPDDEPASVLLKKIRSEKEKLIKKGKIKKEKPLSPIDLDEIPFDVPKSWVWVRLGDLLEIITDYHANGSYEYLKKHIELKNEPDYAIMVRTTNFSENGKNNFIYVTKEAYNVLSKSSLVVNDLIMNKIADPGSVFLVPDYKKPMTLAMNLFLLRTVHDFVSNYYLFSYLSINEAYVKSFAKGATTKTITKDAVKQLIVPLPPLKEQIILTNTLTKQISSIKAVSACVTDLIKKNEIMKQSILKKAFEGKLL